jgi:hypothetical protein
MPPIVAVLDAIVTQEALEEVVDPMEEANLMLIVVAFAFNKLSDSRIIT